MLPRIRETLKSEGSLRQEKSGGFLLHSVPTWFSEIEFLNALTYGAAETQRTKLDILHLFCLFKKTSIERKYNENRPGLLDHNFLPQHCRDLKFSMMQDKKFKIS